MTLIVLHLAFLALLLICSGFFSSAEVAFFSLSALQLKRLADQEPAFAHRLHMLIDQPTRLLSSILIGNTLVNVSASGIAYSLVRHLGYRHAAEITIPCITLLLLIFGEIGPKRVAMHSNQELARLYTPLMLPLMKALAPFRALLDHFTTFIHEHFTTTEKLMTEEEFETLVEMSHESGVLNDEELDMVKTIIHLGNLQAADIMIPRQDIIGLDLNDPPEDIPASIRERRVPRLVLYRDNIDNIAGVLEVRDYLLDPDQSLEQATVAPFFVPECAKLDQLLEDFRRLSHRLAVVVDEYGGISGVLTRGDILEEIVGQVDEQATHRKLDIEPLAPGHWLIDAAISLEDLNDKLDLHLDAEGVDRLAGWFTAHLERLPRPGEMIEAQGCRAIVRQMHRHRIILIELIQCQGEAAC